MTLRNAIALNLLVFINLVFCTAYAKIPPADLAQENQYLSARISPDGTKLAVYMETEDKKRIITLDANTFESLGVIHFNGKKEPGYFRWLNNERILTSISFNKIRDKRTHTQGLMAVNYDGENPEKLGFLQVLHILPDNREEILVASYPRRRNGSGLAEVFKVNIYTGNRVSYQTIARSPVPAADFIVSPDGEIHGVSGLNKDGDVEVYLLSKENKEWIQLSNTKFGDNFETLALGKDKENLFVIDNAQRDKKGLYKFNFESSKLEHVYTHEDVDISSIIIDTDRTQVYAIKIDDGYPSYLVLEHSSNESKVFKNMIVTFPDQEVTITSSSTDGTKWVVFVSSDTTRGAYYLFDIKNNRLQFLFKNYTHIDEALLAKTTPIKFKASDGLDVSGYISYPKNTPLNGIFPLVVLVHGGPRVRDYWNFNSEVHLLTQQGFAVLRVNYRGSSGYGTKHLHAGNMQWGGKIQQDVIDGTKWAIGQGKIDPDKVCIMGGSFGGYSAVQAPILAPDLYKCSVATAGIYDLEMLHESDSLNEWFFGDDYIEEVLGADSESLRAISPVFNMDKFSIPILISHGGKDYTAPIEHAESLIDSLDDLNKPYELFIKKAEGHGFYDLENRIEYYEKVVDFLSRHLK